MCSVCQNAQRYPSDILLQPIFYKSLIIWTTAQNFLILWRWIWWNVYSMRIVSSSWNLLIRLLTTNHFTSTGIYVKVVLKFTAILFFHFLLTKMILAQCVELLILVKRIGWDVMFQSNGFMNTVSWFKIKKYISNLL